jgi:pimeloyl-ACP methyl ester carboxylesterase
MTMLARATRGTTLRGRVLHRPWGRIQVWQGGTGPVLLAIHGLGGSGRYWAGLARLVGSRFTVVAPDLGGFGHSDKPALTYNRAFHVDNLDALVSDVAGDRPVVVVGHSLGGVLSALWAAQHPECVSALALVATPFPAADRRMPARDQQASTSDQRGGRRRLYTAVQSAWPVFTFPVRSRVFPRAVIADYMRHTLPSYWGTAQAVLWDPSTEAELGGLKRLASPVLILSADDDRVVDAGDRDRWAALMPHAERVTVIGGHQLLLRTHFAALAAWLLARSES